MKKILRKLLLIVGLALATTAPLVQVACQHPPSERVNQFKTLAIVGQTAKSSIDAAAILLRDQKITVAQFDKVAKFYDKSFQPTFTLAVATANSDLSTPASAEVLGLAAQLATLIAQLTSN